MRLIFVKIDLYALLNKENTKTSPLKSFVSSSFWSILKEKEFFVHVMSGHVGMLGKIKGFISLIFVDKRVVFI